MQPRQEKPAGGIFGAFDPVCAKYSGDDLDK